MSKKRIWELPEQWKDQFSISKRVILHHHSMKVFHAHEHYEIMYIAKNERIFFLSGKNYHIDDQCLVFVPPGVSHRGESGKKLPQVRIIINFTPDYIHKIASVLETDILSCFHQESPVLIFSNEQIESITEILNKMQEEYNKIDSEDKSTTFLLYLCQILTLARQGSAKSGISALESDKMLSIIQYINHYYYLPITLDYLAQTFFLSKYDISRKFPHYANTTMVKYLNQIRLNHAKKLLETTNYSITDISAQCGFNSSAHLGKVFKAEFGHSPLECRKKIRGASDNPILEMQVY